MGESPEAGNGAPPQSSRTSKLLVLLVSTDEDLWPQVSAQLSPDMTARQFDAIEELIAAMPAGQNAVVLWDARGERDVAGVLTRLQVHSARLALVALDDAGSAAAPAWASRQKQQQVVAVLALPAAADEMAAALASAREEAAVRIALLGPEGAGGAAPAPTPRAARPAWLPFAVGGMAVAALAGAVAFVLWHPTRGADAPTGTAGATGVLPTPRGLGAATPSPGNAAGGPVSPGTDDQVFTLIDKAQQAMAVRHFIDPMEGSALSLYREALVLDPANGEARQGSQRIEEILVSRVQAALDDRKLDVALQSLETARSIDPDDARVKALDARLAGLRSEIGPAQILAAITAQNFDRATQLIDDAARAKLLPPAKLVQLRDEVRRHQADQEAARLSTLIDARLQQDQLIDPARDSALFYLNQARAAGLATLPAQWLEFYRRGTLAARAAIDQHRFLDADRWLGDLRASGLGAAALAGLQQTLAGARAALPSAQNKPLASPFVELIRTRLASGNATEPEGDSALYYVNQLRATDPQNAQLAQLSSLTQSQVLDRARGSLEAGQLPRAETLLQLAGGLGASPETAALEARLQTAKAAASAPAGPPAVTEGTLRRLTGLTLDYPAEARRKEQQGWVEIAYSVSAEGKVSQAHVLNASPAGTFDGAALKAITRLRYEPPRVDGKAAAVTTAVRLVFRLEN